MTKKRKEHRSFWKDVDYTPDFVNETPDVSDEKLPEEVSDTSSNEDGVHDILKGEKKEELRAFGKWREITPAPNSIEERSVQKKTSHALNDPADYNPYVPCEKLPAEEVFGGPPKEVDPCTPETFGSNNTSPNEVVVDGMSNGLVVNSSEILTNTHSMDQEAKLDIVNDGYITINVDIDGTGDGDGTELKLSEDLYKKIVKDPRAFFDFQHSEEDEDEDDSGEYDSKIYGATSYPELRKLFVPGQTPVKLITDKYGVSENNPVKGTIYECSGIVTKIRRQEDKIGYPLRVVWSNGITMHYHGEDLEILGGNVEEQFSNPNRGFKIKKQANQLQGLYDNHGVIPKPIGKVKKAKQLRKQTKHKNVYSGYGTITEDTL